MSPPSPMERLLRRDPGQGWRLTGWAIALLVVGLVAWASVARLDEVTVAEGEVIPQGKVKSIQHLEGGIITDILVQEGDVVTAGEPLLQLDLGTRGMEREELDIALAGLRLTEARLEAEATGAPLSLPGEDATAHPAMAAREQELYESRVAEYEHILQGQQEALSQRRQEITEAEAELGSVRRELRVKRRKLALSAGLVRDGLVPRMEHLELQGEVENLQGQVSVLEARLPRLRSALKEAEQKIAQTRSGFRREALTRQREVSEEIARIRERMTLAEDQERRTLIRSPIDGVVKNMRYNTLGAVAGAGEVLMDIVPTKDKLVIAARLRPVDRGYVRKGQPAFVKISTYDFVRYGGLEGVVILVAPDSTTPEDGAPYFRVLVETDRTQLGTEEDPLPITPGMVATVDIHTGQKTVLDYFIKPVLKLKHEAFRER